MKPDKAKKKSTARKVCGIGFCARLGTSISRIWNRTTLNAAVPRRPSSTW
jgi:hypothetical protein